MLRLYIQTVVVVCFCAGGNIASIETAGNLKTPKFATGGKSAWVQQGYEQKHWENIWRRKTLAT